MHHATRPRRFPPEKARKSLHSPSYPTAQDRIKAGAVGQARDESLDAAAIKISVAFYKEGCKP